MRSLIFMILTLASVYSLAQGYPPMNFNDSPLNFNNSPLNFDNSALNFNSSNGIYDNRGNRIGYETTSPSGVTNFFDNNGNRMGYSPSRR